MSAPVLPPIPPNIAALTGPPLIGICLNWGLYGALTVQTYIYSQCFPNDRKFIKLLVYGLYILETVGTALSTGDAMQWFSIGYGNMIALSKPQYSAIDAPIIDAIISLVVQIFFCWRIWVLSKSWLLSGVIAVVSLAQSICGIASGILTMQMGDVTHMDTIAVWLIIWFTGSALADTMIAGAMTYLLLRHSSNQFRFKNGDVIGRIVRLTIETNSLTAAVAIVAFIMTLIDPSSSLIMAPAYTLGKLYTNTLLVVFNNRIFLSNPPSLGGRNGTLSEDAMHTRSRQIRPMSTQRGTETTTGSPGGFKIEIFKETDVDSDLQLKPYESGKGLGDSNGAFAV